MGKGKLALFLAALAGDSAAVPTDTYQDTCSLPSFDWAAYGTRLTGRMYTRRAALLGDNLYAAGYLKSTLAPNKEGFVESDQDFGVTGPYTTANPTGVNATSITSDLVSYTTEYGSFAQYEVGVVKIDATSGEPLDVYVYYGEGQDETSGLAVKKTQNGDNVMVVSGHFVGALTAEHAGNTSTTIYNSNANGTADYVLHPNAVKNGYDDGFVIMADADTGLSKWIIRYPESNKDAQTVGVDIDHDGNVYGSGYACNVQTNETVVCDAFVAKFAASDGSVVWEKWFTDLGAAFWIVYDDTDHSLYVTGTTTYKGDKSDHKNHDNCKHDSCAATMRLSASDGSCDWIRTTKASPRWNFFDQSGDVRLANSLDGPYIYVAFDDAGQEEEGVADAFELDAGTPYSGCLKDGILTPEYEVSAMKKVTADDCGINSTFVSGGFPAEDAKTGAVCGAGSQGVDACVIKYHKYTGKPIWGSDIHSVSSLVTSTDGKSIMAVGYYWHNDKYTTGTTFDTVQMPDYNNIEGAYNAKLDAATGRGSYVMHSGGVGKTRPYDAVGAPDGSIYMVGYTQSSVIHWGGTLKTKIIEEGDDQNDDAGTAFQMGKVASNTGEYQFFAVKLDAEKDELPSCVESCESPNNIANPTIKSGHCLIQNVCYADGDTSEIFGRPCLVCDANKDQMNWSFGSTIGTGVCFVENVCFDKGDNKTFRESRQVTHISDCQMCDPGSAATNWTIREGFEFTAEQLPNDCISLTNDNNPAPTATPPTTPANPPTTPANPPTTPANPPTPTAKPPTPTAASPKGSGAHSHSYFEKLFLLAIAVNQLFHW